MDSARLDMARKNRVAVISYSVIAALLLGAYVIEFVKGSRTLWYLLAFAAILIVPLVLCHIAYRVTPSTKKPIYVFSMGFSITYGFVMLTTTSVIAFTYIVLLLIILVMYADFKLSLTVSIYSLIINIVQIIERVIKGEMDAQMLTNSEIQVALILFVGIFAIVSARILSDISNKQVEEATADKVRVEQMLSKIMNVSSAITKDISFAYEQTGKVKDAANITKNSMEDLSQGAYNTAESVQTQRNQTEEIQSYIEDVAAASRRIQTASLAAKNAIDSGKKNMDNLMQQVNASKSAGEQVTIQLTQLGENTVKMQSIIELIEQITTQTGLLALNASIEAARAGEAGRGFAVVADEISNLANQTTDATVSITELINGISVDLKEVVSAIKLLVASNDKQNVCAADALVAMNDVAGKSSAITVESDSLKGSVEKLTEANKVIVDSIQEISAVTEEVSAHAQETLAGSEENAQTVEKIVELMQRLSAKAEELSNV